MWNKKWSSTSAYNDIFNGFGYFFLLPSVTSAYCLRLFPFIFVFDTRNNTIGLAHKAVQYLKKFNFNFSIFFLAKLAKLVFFGIKKLQCLDYSEMCQKSNSSSSFVINQSFARWWKLPHALFLLNAIQIFH